MKFQIRKEGLLWSVAKPTDTKFKGYEIVAANLTRIEAIELITILTYEAKK
tara:strand:- start:102 stop:254 length:153 start_codon:yes stop_codon:yes gene_type:complete